MIRKNSPIEDFQNPSVNILDDSEINTLFLRCDEKHVSIAKKELKEGARVLQVYHPDFLLKPIAKSLNVDFLNTCIKDVLSSAIYDDYWILVNPLIPEDPTTYIVAKNHSSS